MKPREDTEARQDVEALVTAMLAGDEEAIEAYEARLPADGFRYAYVGASIVSAFFTMLGQRWSHDPSVLWRVQLQSVNRSRGGS